MHTFNPSGPPSSQETVDRLAQEMATLRNQRDDAIRERDDARRQRDTYRRGLVAASQALTAWAKRYKAFLPSQGQGELERNIDPIARLARGNEGA